MSQLKYLLLALTVILAGALIAAMFVRPPPPTDAVDTVQQVPPYVVPTLPVMPTPDPKKYPWLQLKP